MTTPEALIVAAASRSASTSPQVIATAATELLDAVRRYLIQYFAVGARLNRDRWSATATVPLAAGVWSIPAAVDTLWYVARASDGAKVYVVPPDEATLWAHKPSAMRLGLTLQPIAGNVLATGSLVLTYTRRPDTVATLTSPIDLLWPEDFNPLLELELAVQMAIKDERPAEAAEFSQQLVRWQQLFSAAMENDTRLTSRRTAHLQPQMTHAIPPGDTGG